MSARFVIAENGYALLMERDGQWIEIAALPGGARALLPASRPVDECALEKSHRDRRGLVDAACSAPAR